jgi:hypothetical protein
VRLPARPAILALALLLIAVASGCGENKAHEGPPFEPANIERPSSLRVTEDDLTEVGESTPYGTILALWKGLQDQEPEVVKRSYAEQISRNKAKSQIEHLRPRNSMPIEKEVEIDGDRAIVRTYMRSAVRFVRTPTVVGIADFPVAFSLVREGGEWKVRRDSFRRYLRSQRYRRQLATQN